MIAPSIPEHEKAAVRTQVFHHLAGLVLAPTVKALADRKLFDLFEGSSWLTLDQVLDQVRGNRGYLRVALRLLVSCGWLKQWMGPDGQRPCYSLTAEGRLAVRLAPPLYGEVNAFIPKAIFLEDFLFGKSDEPVLPSLRELVTRAREKWGLPPQQDPAMARITERIRGHVDGMLVGPAMVALARGGVLRQLEGGSVPLQTLSGNQASLECVCELLATQGWIVHDQRQVELTPRGHYASQIATSYGVTVSYLPLFNNVDMLLFGNPRIPRLDEHGVELLVNRGMNVWGSGGAHKTYFKKVDEVVVEIFSRPLNFQPQGICDMGCGDGSFLEHLYSVVKNHTPRGRVLDAHPLVLVGADFNKVARRVAKQTLRRAGVPNYFVIHGDINRPAQLAGDLEELGLDIHDLLHVRSFLDHNRPYIPPSGFSSESRAGRSTGAFSYLGDEISRGELEENLVRHLRRWAPYVGRFGLLVLELHTLDPDLTAASLDKTPAVGYDGTHGFSDQYLVELPIFLDCARQAGLQADQRYQCKFPPSELATVSLNFFSTTV